VFDRGWGGVLAALIAAVRDTEDGGGLIATLPVAGATLVERQVRLAVAAGAAHIVVLVERLPASFTTAIDRLRRDGIAVEVARSAADGADRFHPDERVLVLADGALASAATIARLAHLPAPALLTLGESGPTGAFERIDAATRWSGVALVSGDLLRKTVAMLGDWDLHSTLLRRAVGVSARRLDIADGADTGDAQPILLVRSRAGARAATEASLVGDTRGQGWAARFVFGPAARLATGMLLDRPVEARWLRWAGAAGAILAIPAAWRGWLLAALVLLALAALLDATGRLLAGVRLAPSPALDRPGLARNAAAALSLLAYAAHRLDAGTTPLVFAVATIAALAATVRERLSLARLAAEPIPGWIADGDALMLLFALGAAAGRPLPTIALLALYAAASFGTVQHRLVRAAAQRV
jgi:hypothetical protein